MPARRSAVGLVVAGRDAEEDAEARADRAAGRRRRARETRWTTARTRLVELADARGVLRAAGIHRARELVVAVRLGRAPCFSSARPSA